MKTSLAALLSGIVFGLGLAISEMINPARVIGFLDISGQWDLTLMLVMGSALAFTLIGFPLITRKAHPILAEKFTLPTKKTLDLPLISGAVLFGIGWGLAGLCPGPAIAGLASLNPGIFLFVAAMIAGQFIGLQLEKALAR
ncbi:MAG: YeeE/YedE family protein [Pseudomonadales bacterium]|nr:YeeE/YedE family protein [Pseudomonadales bacterium]MCP5329725.1 YeeE/YedE family protein [Pseudomonadales bacterium]MCP5343736.1 YeeE/YedE family protein [Pseudomonadales bacterium]